MEMNSANVEAVVKQVLESMLSQPVSAPAAACQGPRTGQDMPPVPVVRYETQEDIFLYVLLFWAGDRVSAFYSPFLLHSHMVFSRPDVIARLSCPVSRLYVQLLNKEVS